VDLLLGGGEGNVALRVGAHVELMDLRQELPGHRRVCGGGVLRHAVQPAVPEESLNDKSGHFFLCSLC